MKLQKTHTYALKLHSSFLEGKGWNYTTSIKNIRQDHCAVVSLNDSQVLRWLEKMNHKEDSDVKARQIKDEIKELKTLPSNKNNKRLISEKYDELYKMRFTQDYMMVVFDKKSHYDRARKGFTITIDGKEIRYRRFIGTANSIKKSTIIFINEEKYDKLMWHMNNGRDMNKEMVPAKLEAYLSLACSGSVPLKEFPRVAVVNDCITYPIIPELIHLDYTDESKDEPVRSILYNQKIEMNGSDGFGLMTPEFSKRVNAQFGGNPNECITFNSRCAFVKGMLVPFDFVDFAEKKANSNYIIKDAWGNEQDIRNIDVILTVSMLKLWDSYKSCEDYVANCKEHDFEFSIAKTAPHKLDSQQTSNYQFLQGYTNLSDDDIDELIFPTVNNIKNALGLDWKQLILYMCGKGLDEKTYKYADVVARAIMICPDIVNDKYVRSRIEKMIKKRIRESMIGKLDFRGNFQIITGDPYCLAESIFGIEKNGLLKSGEAYSKYWVDLNVNKVAAFRAPMLTHNNTALLNIVHNEDIDYWFQYIKSTLVLNNFSDICMRECGCDYDSDTLMTTDNNVLVNKYRLLPAIDCVSLKPNKTIPTEDDFVKSEKKGFIDKIGSITNVGTAQLNMQAGYNPDTEEYKQLGYRVECCMLLQQSAIDAVKGAWSRPTPAHWINRSANVVNDGDSEDVIKTKLFNQKLVTKKPYFFIYNYDYVYKDYMKYIKNVDANSVLRFGKSLDTLLRSKNLSEDEEKFVKDYYEYMPVDCSPGTINRICWKIENEFKTIDVLPDANFDYHILTSNTPYNSDDFDAVKKLYKQYIQISREINKTYATKNDNTSLDDMMEDLYLAKERIYEQCLAACNNEKALTNILLELCYNSGGSKYVVWDLCGEQIIQNLLEKNNYKYVFPSKYQNGNIIFDGEKFSLKEVYVNEECDF